MRCTDLALLRGGQGAAQSQAVRGRVQDAGGAGSLLMAISAIASAHVCALNAELLHHVDLYGKSSRRALNTNFNVMLRTITYA